MNLRTKKAFTDELRGLGDSQFKPEEKSRSRKGVLGKQTTDEEERSSSLLARKITGLKKLTGPAARTRDRKRGPPIFECKVTWKSMKQRIKGISVIVAGMLRASGVESLCV